MPTKFTANDALAIIISYKGWDEAEDTKGFRELLKRGGIITDGGSVLLKGKNAYNELWVMWLKAKETAQRIKDLKKELSDLEVNMMVALSGGGIK